ncbi:hypothetical protein AGMMS50262_21820 [Bacteroidia bacterium]|nr:hypothetical protein AGMMS50262_21820 [Bacteroidia bacterium]
MTAEEYYQKGIDLHKAEKYDEAISDFDKAISLKPDDFVLIQYRAHAKMKLAQYEEALDDWNKFIELTRNIGYYWREQTEGLLLSQKYREKGSLFESFQDETTGKYGFRHKETGEIVVAPEYCEDEVSDFLYYRGKYIAFLGEHLYLTLDGKVHAFSPDEL